MPYSSTKEVPAYVPKAKRKQWLEVFNSAYESAKKDGKSDKQAEQKAFAEANGVAGHDSKKAASANVRYEPQATGDDHCEMCEYYESGVCTNAVVQLDPNVPVNTFGQKAVAAHGWCTEFESITEELKSMEPTFTAENPAFIFGHDGLAKKFIPFAKVDASKHEVWGIVTAELPDKEDEVCDYGKSKPYYQAVIEEMGKATDGKNYFPLRAMHQLKAVGKCIGYELRDDAKEVFMGFKVVDDAEWKKVEEGVYTGFSQGGRKVGAMWDDPIYKGCQRYVANPSEASLVDNPCLGAAHFAYIKTDGTLEMRKFSKIVPINSYQQERIAELVTKAVAVALGKKGKTKRKGGKDLTASDFAYVGDANDPSTWKLPIHDAAHCRNALARFNQTKGIPAGEKDKVYARIVAACKRFGIDVSDEQKKMAALYSDLRKRLRRFINRQARKGDVGPVLSLLDSDLAKAQRTVLAKGMYEVSFAAQVVENLASLLFQVKSEQEWERDEDSELPERLQDSVESLLETLVLMAQEETGELRDAITARMGA